MERKEVILEQAKKYDNFYLYDESVIVKNINQLKQAFPQIEFLYSVKCNPNPNVVKCVFSQGFGADAASLGEVMISKNNGVPKEKILYSAPGKTIADIKGAIDESIIIADSIAELGRIEKVAAEKEMVVSIGVRLNPNFSFYGENGGPNKFGIDENQLYEFLANNSYKHIQITGIHVHLKSQELKQEVLIKYYEKVIALAHRIESKLGRNLDYVNMGSGIGIPYALTDVPLDVASLGAVAKEQLDAFVKAKPKTRLIIEVGRYAVGKSGVYATTVVDKKTSFETTFVILQSTLNGFTRPSIANIICKMSENPPATEPVFTGKGAFEFIPLVETEEKEKVNLVGNLCTAADAIAEGIELPRMEVGDVVVITNAGSYAAVLSPMQFASLERPKELFLKVDGSIVL